MTVWSNQLLAWLERAGALDIRDAIWGVVQALLVAGGVLVLMATRFPRVRGVAPAVCLLITAVDLAVANGWMLAREPIALWRAPPAAVVAAEGAAADGQRDRWTVWRDPRRNWVPVEWSQPGSKERLAELLNWDCDTLYPRLGLLVRQPVSESRGALEYADVDSVWRVARRFGGHALDSDPLSHSVVLPAWGARYLILPDTLTGLTAGWQRGPQTTAGARMWTNASALPMAWIADHVVRLDPLDTLDSQVLDARTEQVFFPHGVPRDLAHAPVVEALPNDVPGFFSKETNRVAAVERNECEVESDQGTRVAVRDAGRGKVRGAGPPSSSRAEARIPQRAGSP